MSHGEAPIYQQKVVLEASSPGGALTPGRAARPYWVGTSWNSWASQASRAAVAVVASTNS